MASPRNMGLRSFKVIIYIFIHHNMIERTEPLKWRGSIDHVRFWLLVRHCNYSPILYHFRVIWHWIISWLRNLASMSLKVIETGAIRKLGCGFLFAFYTSSLLYLQRLCSSRMAL